MSFATRVAGSPNPHQQEYYYTGKNIHATSGSRTANTTDLQVGDVLALDPFGHDKGRGYDLANPTANYLSQPLYVVTAIKTNANGDAATRGGTVMAVPLAKGLTDAIQCNVNATATAGVTTLGPTNMASASVNQRYLVDIDPTLTNSTNETIKQIKAKAMETSSSGTAAIRWVCPV